MISDTEHFLVLPLDFWISYLEKYLFKIFAHL